MSMKKIILIGGDLASGKSTLSYRISERFNISCFNKDILKEIFAEDIETHNREENKKLSVSSFKIFRYLATQNVSPIILESNFKVSEMEELGKILKEHEYDILSLRLTGDFETLHKRFIARLSMNRNPIHKSVDLSRLQDFIDENMKLRNTVYPGEVIDIDASTFAYQEDEELFRKIEDFLKR